jgi:uncharacterized RDD family membrane protein YckC
MEKSYHFGSLALKDLHCPHCGALNAEGEPRCHRCGQHLPADPAEPGEIKPTAAASPPRQVALFDDRPKIIPFETIGRSRAPARPPRRQERSTESRSGVRADQPPLDLRPPAASQRRNVNYDAKVAPPRLRLKAAAVDALLVALGAAVAVGILYARGGELPFTGRALLPSVGALAALGLFYQLFWCVLGRETAGMRCFGLELLTFDGHRPAAHQYVLRFIVTCLGVVAVGIGPAWSLVDDETLTWQDLLSKTFPTVRGC